MSRVDHALRVLEFDRALEAVARRAVSGAGADEVRALMPLQDRDAASRTLEAVGELRGVIESPEGWKLSEVPDLRSALRRLAVDDAVLEAADLLACGAAMAVARTNRALERRLGPEGLPARLVGRLWGDEALEKRIRTSFDADGEVADRASPELRRIRRTLVDRRAGLVDRLDRFARALPDRARVSDASITVRNGRYCVPVRREGKGGVEGLVHDASATRQTLFIEPTVAIEPMNEIRELELAEAREVERILRALSSEVRARLAELSESYRALVALDALRARALFAAELDASPPTFVEAGDPIRIRGARHPLLALAPGGAVPFDLDLASDERVLLVSGPNAGGKTVLLKTVGLAAALAQSGVIPPLGEGTRLPFFRRIFAVIGDEQSIDASLSTFGAQASNLAEILGEAGAGDLVLIDEIGSATDPAEGGALAAATLTRLSRQARLTAATTHLGDLKRLGDESSATVNASLEFDGRKLEPTFRLVRDRPGRSYALVIAARLGVPDEVLEDARARLAPDHVSLDTLLARLEEERREVGELKRHLERQADQAVARERELADREQAIAAAERAAEGAGERARNRALKEARDLVEAAIARFEAESETGGARQRRKAAREARGTVERALRESSEAVREAVRKTDGEGSPGALQIGDRVSWEASARSGTLVEIRGGRGVVDVDGLRLTIPLGDLAGHPAERARPLDPKRSAPAQADVERRPEFRVQTEVDLRGLRVEEVDAALYPVIDSAVVSELPFLRIIHGKGTGAVKARVREILDSDTRVRAFRSGKPNEGGAGVTVVQFD